MAVFCQKNVPEIPPEVVVPARSGALPGTVKCMILHENIRSGQKTFRPEIRNGNILILKVNFVPVFSLSLGIDRGRNEFRPLYLVNPDDTLAYKKGGNYGTSNLELWRTALRQGRN